MSRIRLVLADDHPVVLQGLSRHLGDQGFDLVKCAGNGDDCLAAIRSLRPDCALMDVSMPALTGLEVLARLRLEDKTTPVILFSGDFKDWQLGRAVKAGANGLVSKDEDLAQFSACIQAVMAGGRYCSPGLQARMDGDGFISRLANLTDREHDTLVLVRQGLSNKDIGRRLCLTEGTIKTHLHNIYRKLSVPNRASLAMLNI